MKKLLFLFAVGSLVSLSSCEKCSTCTFNDPEQGELVSDDVCQKGKQYDHVLEMYDRNGWTCTEK
ncbi:hypothetical protein N8085_02730 [Salibacteraceae bacterium]|jgi:hypothetical protein|nr:hypothetical protein [Bacteroidota bacterium]MDC1204301.1 hypothetical protein [Salibacteraceae bacterium]